MNVYLFMNECDSETSQNSRRVQIIADSIYTARREETSSDRHRRCVLPLMYGRSVIYLLDCC